MLSLLALGACHHATAEATDALPITEDVSRLDAIIPDAPPACANVVTGSKISFREIGQVASTGATLAISPPGDVHRLLVLEQTGAIKLFKDEVLQARPFIDLSSEAGGPVIGFGMGREEGLLGFAFHPQYAVNHTFYIFYTGTRNGDFHDFLARCKTSDELDVGDPTSCVEMIAITDPASNHNGGMLQFGPDGYLYVSTGDGGLSGDPWRYAQNTDAFFGKILRLDVDHPASGKEYGIPVDNPFPASAWPEVYMLGMRNPWRWSFDMPTGDMWIGDVGQGLIEELDYLPAGQQVGRNLGWSVYEGSVCCATTDYKCLQNGAQYPCDPTGLTFPKDERTHDAGWAAIIDGYTYRGACYPDLVGWHFYTDYQLHELFEARPRPDGSLEIVDTQAVIPGNPSSIYPDGRGELYVTTDDGHVYHLEVTP